MLESNYIPGNSENWIGRIDSFDDYDAYRWHQWVKFIDLRDKSLEAYDGKLGFCIIGFCCDKGIKINKGRPGAANAPYSIRKELSKLPCWFKEDVKIFDAGNIVADDYISLSECQEKLSYAVDEILNLNLFPLVLGGGHETAYGHYTGISKFLHKKGSGDKIGIINFDAHFDLRPYDIGPSSGSMFRQIADDCKNNNEKFSYMCLGIQKYGNTVQLFKTADELGVDYILEKDISNLDCWSIIDRLNNFITHQDYIYVTICSDVFSSAFAPGVSATQPMGLDPNMVLHLLKHIIRTRKLISFDVSEVSPRFDQDNITANLAKVIIFAVVNTLCQLNNLSIDQYNGKKINDNF